MMSFMVSEAARGVDLAERYPAFYRRLQEEPDLRERFEDSLDLLRRSQTNTLEPLPGPPYRDLSFLHTRPRPTCSLIPPDNGHWGMTLTLSAEQLNRRFFPFQVEPVTRQGLGIGVDEDNWFTLIRETVSVADSSWSIVLEGTPVDETEDVLQLAVIVVPSQDSENGPDDWQATLVWGSYEVTVVLNGRGRATFPEFHFGGVLDEDELAINENLVLTLACCDT